LAYTDEDEQGTAMNSSIFPLTLLLPILAAANAAAQLTTIRFAAPVDPIAGLPKLLPSPMTGPLAGTGISLPSMQPALKPSLSLPGAVSFPAYLPAARMPAREEGRPAASTRSSRREPAGTLRRVTPGVVFRFSGQAAASKPGAAKPDAAKERLDAAFDGDDEAPKPAVDQPRRGPVSPGRSVGLPEWDLERELGI
jgi:hypothetical protein